MISMKKLYSLILSALPLFCFAQPTITQADEPVLNLAWGTAVDTTYSAAIPAGGANVTWDYTGLITQKFGGARFIGAGGTPFASNFPTATLADSDSTGTAWLYFFGNASGFYLCGIDSNSVSAYINPALLLVPVPFTYLDTRSSTARIQIDTNYMGSPARIVRTYKDDFTADGWGTLKVPGNIFTNTLRIKDRQMVYDTAYVDTFSIWIPVYENLTQSHYYRWARHNGPDAYLLQLDADSLGTTATRSEYEIISLISVPEIDKETVHVTSYPNPSRDVINVAFDKSVSGNISVYNSVGELVRSSAFTDINQYVMYVNTMAAGLYHFTVTASDNKMRSGSFVVNK
jgi:hypothetical protein